MAEKALCGAAVGDCNFLELGCSRSNLLRVCKGPLQFDLVLTIFP